MVPVRPLFGRLAATGLRRAVGAAVGGLVMDGRALKIATGYLAAATVVPVPVIAMPVPVIAMPVPMIAMLVGPDEEVMMVPSPIGEVDVVTRTEHFEAQAGHRRRNQRADQDLATESVSSSADHRRDSMR